MFKKIAIGLSCIIAFASAFALAGCGEPKDYDALYADKVKVVYELEGGYYGNTTIRPQNVRHYYDYVDGLTITAPSKDVMRDGGYEFEGWFTGTRDEDGVVHYGSKWVFERDTVPKQGITLYAKWKAPSKYAYEFVYTDENGEEISLVKYSVGEGKKFGESYGGVVLKWINGGPEGKTAVGVYYDKELTHKFDDSIVPVKKEENGEEVGDTVKLYVDFIDGEYTVVSAKDELIKAVQSPANKFIYLFNDIDMGGSAFNFYKYGNFNNRTLIGNGNKIYNFTVEYSDNRAAFGPDFEGNGNFATHVSLFGSMTNTTLKDISFEDVTVVLNSTNSLVKKFYVAPLAVSAKDCTFEGVGVKASFAYGKLPKGDGKTVFDENFAFDADRGVYANENATVIFVTGHGTYRSENSKETGCDFSGVVFEGKTQN